MSQGNAQVLGGAQAKPLSVWTRICYGLGDTACNISWGAMGIVTFFYTDYAGVSPAIVGSVMLFSRCFDGVSDVIMGFVVERTKSKWGKARPWVLWGSVPFALSIVFIYLIPQGMTETMQFAYIFATYNFCTTVCYTMLNLPYGALSALMTPLSHERDMLSIFRMTLSPMGKILSVSATLPLIKLFGDNQQAWIIVMSFWAVVALCMFLLCFKQCEEKVFFEAREKVKEVSKKIALKAIVYNKYFWLATGLWVAQATLALFIGTILPYYCRYVIIDDTYFSLLFLVETLTTVIATIIFCPTLLKKFGKRNMSLYGVILGFIGHAIFLINPTDRDWLMFSCFIRGLCFAPFNSVIFGFFGDVVDYTQWKFRVRPEGLIFSGGSVGYKIGGGLVSAIITGLLTVAGYIASTSSGVVQPQSVIDMIISIYSYGILIIWGWVIVFLLAWKLEKIYPQIVSDLAERSARGEM